MGSISGAAAGENSLLGTWKLKSYTREMCETGERFNPLGRHPHGYLHYLPDGRMSAILAGDNRVQPAGAAPADDERVMLHRTMTAYAGTYTLEPGKVLHHVDISWNEAWTGTNQIRFYELEGDTLTITTAPAKSPVDGMEGRSILVWERVRAPAQ